MSDYLRSSLFNENALRTGVKKANDRANLRILLKNVELIGSYATKTNKLNSTENIF